jgi:hypothetical protein
MRQPLAIRQHLWRGNALSRVIVAGSGDQDEVVSLIFLEGDSVKSGLLQSFKHLSLRLLRSKLTGKRAGVQERP